MGNIRMIFPDVYVFEGQQFYDEAVNTYLLLLNKRFILIDLPDYTPENVKFISSFRINGACYLTHGPTGTKEGDRLSKDLGISVYVHEADKDNKWLSITSPVLWKGEKRNIEAGAVFYHTPGHTMGSVSFYYQKESALFTGDTIHGDENNEIDDFSIGSRNEDVALRMKSCVFLSSFPSKHILPFHGSIITEHAAQKLQTFIDAKFKK